MGWKAFNLLTRLPDAPLLNTYPPHRPDQARTLLAHLAQPYQRRGESTFELGLYPNHNNELYIGAYGQSIVLGSIPIIESIFAGSVPPIIGHLNALLPGCQTLAISLHSVVDLFGYALFENGQLVRGRAGTADTGVFFETGHPLPGEQSVLDDDPGGEDIVMELCRPFLGCRIDEFDAWDLKMELFIRKKGWLERLLRR